MSDAATGQHVRELHDRAVVITSHDHLLEYDDIVAMNEGGLDARVIMVQADVLTWDDEGPGSCLSTIYSYEGWARRALTKIERTLRLVDDHPDRLVLVRGADDILGAQCSGRSGIIIGFEGARPLEGSVDLLRLFYRLGLRHLQLTWSYGNQVCDRVSPPPGEVTWSNHSGSRAPGLTDFGREVIREANRLGIVLDPGHCSEQTFWELLELSEKPVVISHANCRDAGKNAGDVGDDKLRAIAGNGGVLCVHFFSHIIRDRGATVDDLVDHIRHAADVAGIEHVGLGPDWLPLTPEFLRVHDQFAGLPAGFIRSPDRPLGPLTELDSPSKLPRLTEQMIRRGFTDEEVEKVLGANLLRLYREVWQ